MMSNSIIKSRRYWAILIATFGAIAAMLLLWQRPKHFVRSQGQVWTTEYHTTYEAATRLDDSITAVLAAVDSSASAFNPASLLSRINQNTAQQPDSLLLQLIATAGEVWQASGGAYDPTVMPLVNAWGFGYKSGKLPTQRDLDSLLQFVGWQKFKVQGGKIVKADPRLQLDFSSIAKGLAVDQVGRMLAANGAANWMVEIGGEVAVAGHNPQGKKWRISVDLPSDDGNEQHQSALTLAMDQGAVATSGSYRRYKEVDGKRVSHIVDPRTGLSTESNLLSVTVVAPSCMLADAWATACMALGTERTHSLMEHNSQLGVMTIATAPNGTDLVVWSNKAFARLVEQ